MSPRNDDDFEMTDMSARNAELTTFLSQLRALGEGPAPEPSPEVEALLGGAVLLRPRRSRLLRRVAVAAAAAVVLMVATAVAAAHHSLPAPAQRMVSNVVNLVTPFHIDPVTDPGPRPPVLPTT